MIFKPMKREDVFKALEDQEDILTPAVKRHVELFQSLSCPYCNGDRCAAILDTSRPFREGELLPNYLARCLSCGTDFEPRTGIQVTLPHPSKVY